MSKKFIFQRKEKLLNDIWKIYKILVLPFFSISNIVGGGVFSAQNYISKVNLKAINPILAMLV